MRTTFAAREVTDEPVTDQQLRRILNNARFAIGIYEVSGVEFEVTGELVDGCLATDTPIIEFWN